MTVGTEQAGQLVSTTRNGAVSVLAMAHGPVNALTPFLRAELLAALERALGDEQVAGIVITSALPQFSAGIDVTEHDSAGLPPSLDALCLAIEDAAKPVVMAMPGVVLGGGLELALAAHARVAADNARFGLPEVALGLLPAAGGTQRLPRLIGAEHALRLMLSGRPVPAVEALALGILDQVVEGDPVPAACAMALALAGQAPRRTGDRRDGMRDAVAYQHAIAAARRRLKPGPIEAPAKIIDCVEAALLLPHERGLAFEQAQAADLLASPVSAGLRHAFVAERRAARLPRAIASVEARMPERLVIWGAGGQGAAIALAAIQSGMRVTLADPQREAVVAALERVAAGQEAALQRGALTTEALDADWARLTPQVGPSQLADADVVVLVAAAAPPIAQGATVLSMQAPVPAGAMGLTLSDTQGQLAEIALSDTVAPARAATAFAFARRIGWRGLACRAEQAGQTGAVAAQLARAIAETVAHLEKTGLDRTVIAHALAAHGIAGDGSGARPSRAETEIARRCEAALANVGAKLLEAGILRRPCEVDTAAIAAGMMARHTGGPMFQSDRRGMLVLMRDLRRWSAENPALWQPSPLIEKLWAQGANFSVLDQAG